MKQINASYNLDRRLKCINKKTLPFLEKQFIGKFTPIYEKIKGLKTPTQQRILKLEGVGLIDYKSCLISSHHGHYRAFPFDNAFYRSISLS